MDQCDCKYAEYYRMLYGINVPCIHMILNEQWKNDISEFLIHISINKDDNDDDDEPFLEEFEISDPDPEEKVTDENKNEIVLHENVIQENKVYTDPIQHLIYHCYRQLKKLFNVDKIVVGVTVANVQNDLIRKNTELVGKMDSNYDEYLATLQLHTWIEIYQKYNKMKFFIKIK